MPIVIEKMKAKLDKLDPDRRKEVENQVEALAKLEAITATRLQGTGLMGPAFDTRLDDDEVLLRLFCDLDKDKNGLVDWSELERMQQGADSKNVLLKALQPDASQQACSEPLDFIALKAAARRVPRVSGQRTAWVRSMGLDADLARHLPPGTLDDGLKGLKGMSEAELDLALQAFFSDVRCKFVAEWEKARRPGGFRSAVEANSKFAGFDGTFATLHDFHRGQDLGYPNPDLLKGIRLEHMAHPSSNRLFVSSNYRLATSLSIEYAWAMLYEDEDALAAAEKLLAELREEASESVGGKGESLEARKKSLFPGEVGDSFQESLVMVSWQAPEVQGNLSKEMEEQAFKALEWAGSSVLVTREELARGVQMLSRAECTEWLRKSASVLHTDPPAAETSHTDGSFVVGLVLPMCRVRADGKLEALKQRLEVANEMGSILAGAPVDVNLKACKTWVYCFDVSTEGRGRRLGDMGIEDLKELCYGAGTAQREQLISSALTSFLETELRADFRAALVNASNCQLDSLLEAWGVRGASRAEKIDAAVEALDSDKRWGEVEGWVRLYRGRILGRTRLGIKNLMRRERERIEKNKLMMEEVFATYLYTGPEFIPMNSICRNHPANIVKLLEGEDQGREANRLCTTLFCVSSALKKLGRSTEVPESRTVYRGLGAMRLPAEFWTPSGDPPWRGGVERAFMSTTADKNVALFYANGKGTVVEISVGRIQIGGDVSFLSMVCANDRPADRRRLVFPHLWLPSYRPHAIVCSGLSARCRPTGRFAWQYPSEKEITFPPLTSLEANGEPRVERSDKGEVVVFPLQVRLPSLCRAGRNTYAAINYIPTNLGRRA